MVMYWCLFLLPLLALALQAILARHHGHVTLIVTFMHHLDSEGCDGEEGDGM
jgi:hypothetical protein